MKKLLSARVHCFPPFQWMGGERLPNLIAVITGELSSDEIANSETELFRRGIKSPLPFWLQPGDRLVLYEKGATFGGKVLRVCVATGCE